MKSAKIYKTTKTLPTANPPRQLKTDLSKNNKILTKLDEEYRNHKEILEKNQENLEEIVDIKEYMVKFRIPCVKYNSSLDSEYQ